MGKRGGKRKGKGSGGARKGTGPKKKYKGGWREARKAARKQRSLARRKARKDCGYPSAGKRHSDQCPRGPPPMKASGKKCRNAEIRKWQAKILSIIEGERKKTRRGEEKSGKGRKKKRYLLPLYIGHADKPKYE